MAAAAQGFENAFANIGVFKVALQCEHVLNFEGRLNGDSIDSDNAAAGAHRPGGFLKPTPRPAAEVNHPLPPSQHPMLPLQLGELVHRTRSKTLAFRALVEMVLAVVAGDGELLRLGGDGRANAHQAVVVTRYRAAEKN